MRFAPLSIMLGIAIVLLAAGNSFAAPSGGLEGLIAQFKKGGGTMYFLLVLSIVGLAFTLERALRLRRDRFVPRGLADQARELWSQGNYDGIQELCDERDSALARSIKAIVHFRKASISDIRLVAGDVGTREMRPHMRRVIPLAVVATLSPLLGLFGTVIGMIGAFQNFQLLGETGDPSIFAGDISKAMITTAGGLILAVPALAFYHFFRTRTNAFGDELEAELGELTTEWFVKQDASAN